MDVSTIWDFCGEVVGSIRPRKGYVPATVTRIDNDGTVWVTTGDGTEAPASTCAAGVAVGDVVSVQWSGAQMGVVGNASDPAAGTSTVRAVRKAAESAAKVASGAQAIADAIGQHFFTDDNGVHVSTEKDNPTGERNILMNSLGILLRQGSAWLASFSDSAVAFYDGLGNGSANIVAQFGADGATIGRGSESHLGLDYHSMRLMHPNLEDLEEAYFQVGDLRDRDGNIVEEFHVTTIIPSFTVSYPIAEVVSVAIDGTETTAYTVSGNTVTLDELPSTTSLIAITYSTSRYDLQVFTFGSRRQSGKTGAMSFSEGELNVASGDTSHAEGVNAEASGNYSHAEGYSSVASGETSHAEGYGSIASGSNSHAQNNHTVAAFNNQTAIGKYNDNQSNHAFEVGNGTADDARSNAFAVAWDGTTTHDGDVPWTTFPLASAASHYNSSKPLRYRKWGQMVNLMGAVRPNADVPAGQNYSLTIGTLPEGCRPQEELTQLCQGSGTASWMLRITTGGVVTAERYRTGSGYAVMPAPSGGSGGAWLTMNCTFIV